MTTNEIDYPTGSSYQAVAAFYRRQHPLYAAYMETIEEFNTRQGPITEPSTGGVSTYEGARIALARIGRPTEDPLSIHMAEAYIARLKDEIRQVADPVIPTITSALIDCWVPMGGCIPDVQTWRVMPADEQAQWVQDLVENHLVDEALIEAVTLAMPLLIEHAISEDRRARLCAVPGEEEGR